VTTEDDRVTLPPRPAHAALKARVRDLVEAEIAALGPTEAKVALHLEKTNSRGACNHAEHCAVATYLEARIQEAGVQGLVPSVNDDRVIVVDRATGRTVAVVETTPSVRDFIAAFDKRKYPQLVTAPAPPASHDESDE
jgi:hypothetical protein